MRRTTLLLVVIGVLLAVASGVALAAVTFSCQSSQCTGTNQGETLDGTPGTDKLAGGGGPDIINAKDGNDQLFGDFGGDTLNAGRGADFINAADGTNSDTINCGGGPSGDGSADTVVADKQGTNQDTINSSCLIGTEDTLIPVP